MHRNEIVAVVQDPLAHAALLDAIPSFVWCADGEGACTFVNRAWSDYTGRRRGSEKGAGWLEAVHPDDREPLGRQWSAAYDARGHFETEFRLCRPDGGHGWVHLTASPVAGKDGLLAGYLGTCHDITERRDAELAARARARELRLLADNVPVLIAHFGAPDLRCLFANRAYARTWGRDVDSIVGLTVAEVIGPEAYREIEPHIQRVMRGEAVTYERTVAGEGGAARVLEINLLPQLAEDGAVIAAFVLISDITRHRHAEQVVRESEERLRKFAEATHEGIVFHEDGVLSDCNDAVLRLTGYTYEELVGRPVLDFVAPESRSAVLANIRVGYERPYEAVVLHRDGSPIAVELTGKVMPFKGRRYRMTVLRDIRDRKEAEARIQFLAHHDTLTGLPNRVLLMDRLEFILASARRRGTRVGILFIDLDDFKVVNDSLGHAAGDALLRLVAGRIQSSLRAVDVVARLGGDEFLVVLPDLETEQSPAAVAEKLLAAVAEQVVIEGAGVAVSSSIGIAVFPRDGDVADTLISNADAAMYVAKERGRNNYHFYSERLARAASSTLTLESRLRESIRDEEFVIHYQPQVRLDTGAVVGMEALVRWPAPDGTLAMPEDFIPVAEQRGLIMPIGGWVLRNACRQNRMWQLSGLPCVPVSVNLSAIQFRQKDLVEEVGRVLADTGLDAQWLELEITERMLESDSPDRQRTLRELRGLGVRLAIDDFGTGHSSLAHLKRLPIGRLKVDRQFVRNVPGDPDDCAIAAAVIDLARNLGITAIAEGVENAAQLDFLRSRGCEEMQGFLASPPLTAAQAAVFLAERRTDDAAGAAVLPRSA